MITPDLGRILILAGSILLVAGLLVIGLSRFNIPLGRLPGDISLHGKSWSFSFPIVTCLILSAVFSFILWLISHFRR
jgi:Protein of unknown function (DUF2905)